MTKADETIREVDKPERLQLATAGLDASRAADDALQAPLAPILADDELNGATEWVAPRIPGKLVATFLAATEGGYPHPLRDTFMMAVRCALEQICNRFLEVPFVWLHRRDFFVHYDPQNPDPRLQFCDLLGRDSLWTIQSLGIKYRAFLDRRTALRHLWNSLQEPVDPAFEDAFMNMDSIEEVADLTDWVNMRYMREIRRMKEVAAEEDAEVGVVKRATRETKYSRIRNTDIYRLAAVRFAGLPCEITTQRRAVLRSSYARCRPRLIHPHPADLRRRSAWTTGRIRRAICRSVKSGFCRCRNASRVCVGVFRLDWRRLTWRTAAKFITVFEFAALAPLRKAVRRGFRDHGLLSITPTEQGVTKIDNLNTAYVRLPFLP